MDFVVEIGTYAIGTIILLFIMSIVKFHFHRKRQIDKVKIVKFMSSNDNTTSTYNLHRSMFKDKPIAYVKGLLNELESEEFIRQIKIGNSSSDNNNGIWELIDG